jgi:CheY-like chemotaxis protein
MTPDELMPHIPQLRRFAMLLTGHQFIGDALIERALRHLLTLPDSRPPMAVRRALFRAVRTIFDEAPVDRSVSTLKRGLIASRLLTLRPAVRQAFLLVSVEGFEPAEAAAILDLLPGEVEFLVQEASRDIAAQMLTSVLLIEDEPLIALRLESIVEGMGHSVVGVAATRTEAVAMAKRARPGLILADIQLADGSSGLEAVREIADTLSSPAVYITAFPKRLMDAACGAQPPLIEKPFEAEQVRSVVSQRLFFHV